VTHASGARVSDANVFDVPSMTQSNALRTLQKRITFDRFARFVSDSDCRKSFLSVLAKIFLHKWIDTLGHRIWMRDDDEVARFVSSRAFVAAEANSQETLMDCALLELRRNCTMNCRAPRLLQ